MAEPFLDIGDIRLVVESVRGGRRARRGRTASRVHEFVEEPANNAQHHVDHQRKLFLTPFLFFRLNNYAGELAIEPLFHFSR